MFSKLFPRKELPQIGGSWKDCQLELDEYVAHNPKLSGDFVIYPLISAPVLQVSPIPLDAGQVPSIVLKRLDAVHADNYRTDALATDILQLRLSKNLSRILDNEISFIRIQFGATYDNALNQAKASWSEPPHTTDTPEDTDTTEEDNTPDSLMYFGYSL